MTALKFLSRCFSVSVEGNCETVLCFLQIVILSFGIILLNEACWWIKEVWTLNLEELEQVTCVVLDVWVLSGEQTEEKLVLCDESCRIQSSQSCRRRRFGFFTTNHLKTKSALALQRTMTELLILHNLCYESKQVQCNFVSDSLEKIVCWLCQFFRWEQNNSTGASAERVIHGNVCQGQLSLSVNVGSFLISNLTVNQSVTFWHQISKVVFKLLTSAAVKGVLWRFAVCCRAKLKRSNQQFLQKTLNCWASFPGCQIPKPMPPFQHV